MKPLIVLLIIFVAAFTALYSIDSNTGRYLLAGRIAMCGMLLFTTLGHFMYTKGMAMMVPPFISFKKAFVLLTGLYEAAAGICLLITTLAVTTGWALIIFFILMLPANIYAAVKHVDYQKGTYDGPGLSYLWFRVPLQVLFIGWVWFFVLR